MPRVVIDGIEYVPRTEVPKATDEATAEAVRELVCWLYLRDKPDNHVWDALRVLSPDLHAMAGEDPRAAYEAAQAALDKARG